MNSICVTELRIPENEGGDRFGVEGNHEEAEIDRSSPPNHQVS